MQSTFLYPVIQELVKIQYGFPVAVNSMTFDGMATGKSGIGDLTEGFPGIYIRNMHLDSRDGNSLQCVQNGNGGVGIGGRIYDNTIHFAKCPLNLVYQITLMVALVLFYYNV